MTVQNISFINRQPEHAPSTTIKPMNDHVGAYFQNLLRAQTLSDQELQALRGLRQRIEGQLSRLEGNPRFYYAGSYGKKTMTVPATISIWLSTGRIQRTTRSKASTTRLAKCSGRSGRS
jgi:hypothetical protein